MKHPVLALFFLTDMATMPELIEYICQQMYQQMIRTTNVRAGKVPTKTPANMSTSMKMQISYTRAMIDL